MKHYEKILLFAFILLLNLPFAQAAEYQIIIQQKGGAAEAGSEVCSDAVPQCSVFINNCADDGLTARIHIRSHAVTFQFFKNSQPLWVEGKTHLIIPTREGRLEEREIILTLPPQTRVGDKSGLRLAPVIRGRGEAVAELIIFIKPLKQK